MLEIWLAASKVGHPCFDRADLDRQLRLVRDHYLPLAETLLAVAAGGRMLGFIGLFGGRSWEASSSIRQRTARALIEHAAKIKGSLDAWNAMRRKQGEAPIAAGISMHYGQAVMGDIGTIRSMAFTIVGDTVNTASQLQGLTRDVGCRLVASDALVARARDEGLDRAAATLATLAPAGSHRLKGLSEPIAIWTAGRIDD